MNDLRISAADLLRLATLASTSPEGSPEEVIEIIQRCGETTSGEPVTGLVVDTQFEALRDSVTLEPAPPKGTRFVPEAGVPDLDEPSDKLAKPE